MRPLVRALLLLPLLAVLAAFLIYPLCVLGYASMQPGRGVLRGNGGAGASASANYVELVSNPIYRDSLLHSLLLSGAVAVSATMLCFAPAWLFARHDFAGKRFLRASFTLPMSLSGIMVGFLAVIMLGRIGFVPQMAQALTGHAWLAGSAYQLTGLVIAYLYFEIPRGILTLETSLRKFSPQLETAARSLGASRWQRFRWVVLPLIAPALVSTFAVTFSVSLGSFGVALILSKRFSVLPLDLFYQFTAILDTPFASAMAVVLIAIALLLNYGIGRWTSRIALSHA